MSYDDAIARIASRYVGAGKQPLSRHQAVMVYILDGRRIVSYNDLETQWLNITGEEMPPHSREAILKRLKTRGFKFVKAQGLGVQMIGTPRAQYVPDEAARAMEIAHKIAELAEELAPIVERMTEKAGK